MAGTITSLLFQWFRDNPITGVVGIIERNPSGNPFIFQGIIRGGELLHVYHKTHLAPEELSLDSADDELCIFSQGGINFGLAICADIEGEDLFRRYSEAGTQVVLHSSPPGFDGDQTTRNWQSGYDWWNGDCKAKLGKYARKHGLTIAAGPSQAALWMKTSQAAVTCSIRPALWYLRPRIGPRECSL